MADAPTFSRFRSGAPLELPGGTLTFRELKEAGLQEYYSRIVHKLALDKKLSRSELDAILKRVRSKDRLEQQRARAELGALDPAPRPAPATHAERPRATTGANSRRAVKTFALVSSGDHKRAVKLAESFSLDPRPVLEKALRPGQSPDAHTVEAPEHIASKLITSGLWKTRP